MKPLLDFLQILLSFPGWWNFVGCFVVVLILAQGFKFTSKTLSFLWASLRLARTWIISLSPAMLAFYGVVALCLWPLSERLSDSIQWVEQAWINPTYISPSDTSAWALQQYENQLDKNLSEAESEIVKRRTREIAVKVGSTPLAIYEVMLSECGLNPFTIRKDGIAAASIQFTTAGLQGLGVSLDRVKQACRERDALFIMDLTERYLIDRAKGHPLPTSTEVYTAVFAPSFVGRSPETVLYSGHNRPSYFLNAGLDGHKYKIKVMPDGRQKIIWFREPDGAITINDLGLALAAKRANFLKSN